MSEEHATLLVGDPRAVHLVLTDAARPYPGDPALDFVVRVLGDAVRIDAPVRTWDGDGLGVFMSTLAGDFRGWEGARSWHLSEEGSDHQLTVSARHDGLGQVRLSWGIHGAGWRVEVETVHDAGEGMRRLADALDAFLESAPGPSWNEP